VSPPRSRVGSESAADRLHHDVILLLARATEMVAMATEMFLDADLDGIDRVLEADAELRRLALDLESEVERRLSTGREPAEVRTLLAVLRIGHELELTSGLVANIAKAGRRVRPAVLDPRIRGRVARLAEQAIAQLRAAADGFADADRRSAGVLAEMNEVMGELIRDLIRASVQAAADQVEDPQSAIQVALMARYFERIGDHATNIATRAAATMPGGHTGLHA
jgi:phosphate transport system protein